MNLATLIRFGAGSFEGIWDGNRYFAHGNLVEIARRYGVGMTVIASEYDLEKVCGCCDGLIVPGSPINIDPSYYGGKPFDEPNPEDEYALDSKVIAAFDRLGKPIFGICGGLQALNVFYGGTLAQVKNLRLPLGEKHAESHDRTDCRGNSVAYHTHMIRVEEDSFVHEVFGTSPVRVNTYHGWAIDRLAEGFRVVARSEDGIIEAIEWKEKRIYATQWHPELANRMGDPVELRFFENFFRRCEEALS